MAKRKILILSTALIALTAIASTSALLLRAEEEKNDDINLPSFYNTTEYFNSNKYTSPENNKVATNQYEIKTTDTLITTNSYGEFYVNKKDLSMKFKSKDGYIHNTSVNQYADASEEVRLLNKENYDYARSAINVFYYDYSGNIMKQNQESLFTNSASKIESLDLTKDGFSARVFFATSGIRLTFNVAIKDDSFTVSIPNNQIEETLKGGEKKDYRLGGVSVYSYFGGVASDTIDGYNFVPDGVGALIRYTPTSENPYNDYSKNVYGEDIAKRTTASTSIAGANISMPVFGYVHGVNQNGMVAYITKGAEYASINATQSTSLFPFYRVYPQFSYRSTYLQPMSSSSNQNISLIQAERNNFDIEITYKFLNGENANYTGMGKAYRDYLLENGKMNENNSSSTSIPLRVDTIGLEVTNGTLFNKKIVMTTFNEYDDIIESIHNDGITNTFGVIKGFSKDGVSWSSPVYKKLSGKLGSINKFDNLDNTYFYMNTIEASKNQSGYSTNKDLAKKINATLIEGTVFGDAKYYLNASSTKEITQSNIKALSKKSINSYALGDIGSTLYSSYAKNGCSREEAKNTYMELLESTNSNYVLYDCNDYVLKYTNKNLDYSMFTSQYLAFDDTVPFTSIVMSGNVELYSTYVNFFSNARDDLLRMVDYNVYPSFLLTNKSASELGETNLNYIYSSKAEDYKDEVKVYYNFVNDALRNVIGASITKRSIPQAGVVSTTYDNGVTILVNYQNKDVVVDGNSIKAKSYLVLGGN